MKELKKVCRVCGNRTNKAKGRERVHLAQHRDSLAKVFLLDVSEDTEDTHPIHFCHPCKTFMRYLETRGGGGLVHLLKECINGTSTLTQIAR